MDGVPVRLNASGDTVGWARVVYVDMHGLMDFEWGKEI